MFVICCDWLCSETNKALSAKSGLQGLYSQLCAVHLCVVPYAWCNIAETHLHDMYHRHQLRAAATAYGHTDTMKQKCHSWQQRIQALGRQRRAR